MSASEPDEPSNPTSNLIDLSALDPGNAMARLLSGLPPGFLDANTVDVRNSDDGKPFRWLIMDDSGKPL